MWKVMKNQGVKVSKILVDVTFEFGKLSVHLPNTYMEKELHISMLKDIFDICVVDSINENKNPHEVCEIFYSAFLWQIS